MINMYSCCDYDDYSLHCIVFENMIFRNLTIRIVIDDPPVKNTMRRTELQGFWILHILNMSIIFIGLSAKIYMTFNNILTASPLQKIKQYIILQNTLKRLKKEQKYIKQRVFFYQMKKNKHHWDQLICITMIIILVIIIILIRQGCVWLFLLNAGNTFIWHRPALLSKV